MVKSRSHGSSTRARPSPARVRTAPAEKGFTVVSEDISMLPASMQVAFCKPCAGGVAKKMTPLVASKSQLIRMKNRNAYGVMGPCSGCGRKRCCFIKKPAGF